MKKSSVFICIFIAILFLVSFLIPCEITFIKGEQEYKEVISIGLFITGVILTIWNATKIYIVILLVILIAFIIIKRQKLKSNNK